MNASTSPTSNQKAAYRRLTDMPAGALKGRRVLIRCDLNAPVQDGRITETTRLDASLPGIRYALDAGAAVLIVSHRGRPVPGNPTENDTLQPMADYLAEQLNRPLPLVRDWVNHPPSVNPGQAVLLENCRLNIGEKQDDETLAKAMAGMCDIYVNDAFGIAHRAEATTHGIARFAKIACAGPLLAAELASLEAAVGHPARPLVAVVGGSKVSTKLTVLTALAKKVDHLVIGGGIANTFLLAAGYPIGKSIAEPDLVNECRQIIQTMQDKGGWVPLPVDVITAKSPEGNPVVKKVEDVAEDDMILDIGPETIQTLRQLIQSANTIVWNGPMGLFEHDAFAEGTKAIAQAIADSGAFSVAGGGDTLAAIAKFGVRDKMGYVSTGGGVFLEFLEGKTLPAVAVLASRADN